MTETRNILSIPICANYSESRTIMDSFLEQNGPLLVGVFSNQSLEEINMAVSLCKLDLVQLHGDEVPQFVRLISAPVIKVIHVMEGDSIEEILSRIRAYEGSAKYILLDTGIKGAKQQGGSGKSFDWNIFNKIKDIYPVILAGGLSISNISQALAYNPWCIDVSSGLEHSVGKKDLKKTEAFIGIIKSE
jgi:phosphoribosylanthranilate isomerase